MLLALIVLAGCRNPPEQPRLPAAPGGRAVASQEPAPDSGFIDVQGGQLYYEDCGSGPALVFIHGGFGDRRVWDDEFFELAQDFRVVRYDHRGFGRSSAPTGPYSPVADLRSLLDALGIDRAHLVGNSLGGELAIDFALLHPGRTASLCLVAGGPGGLAIPEEDRRAVGEVFAAAQEDLEHGLELWLAHPMLAAARQRPEVWRRVRALVSENRSVLRMEHWPNERLQPEAVSRLGELSLPALIVVGSRDTPLMREAADVLARGIPGARKVVLECANHLPQLEQPAVFNGLLREFLARGP